MSDFEYLKKLTEINSVYGDHDVINAMRNSKYNQKLNIVFISIPQVVDSFQRYYILSKSSTQKKHQTINQNGLLGDLAFKVKTTFEYSMDTLIEDPMNALKKEFEKGVENTPEGQVFNPVEIMRVFKYADEEADSNKNLVFNITTPLNKQLKNYIVFLKMFEDDYTLKTESNIENIKSYLNDLSCLEEAKKPALEYKSLLKDLRKIKQIHTQTTKNGEPLDVQAYNVLCDSVLSKFNNSELYHEDKRFYNLEKFIKHFNVNEILNNIEKEFDEIHLKVNEAGIYLTEAEEYIARYKKQSAITKFIKDKEGLIHEDETISYILKTEQAPKYKNAIFFNDNSFLLEGKDGNLKTYQNHIVAKKDINAYFNNYIDFKLRKQPTIRSLFKNVYEYDYLNCFKVIDSYLQYEDILKVNGFDLKEQMAINQSFERIDDIIHHTVDNHQLKKYAHSIASNKYRELYNDASYMVIKELMDIGIPEKDLQDHIGKKIAAYKTPEEFNEALTKYLNTYNHFTPQQILHKASMAGSACVLNEDDLIVLRIKSFDESNKMGSASWCISRSSHYYNSYTSDKSKQYFIYDFKQESTRRDSMIGVTITHSGEYQAAHLKDDTMYYQDEKLNKIIQKIINNDVADYHPDVIEAITNKKEKEKNNLSFKI